MQKSKSRDLSATKEISSLLGGNWRGGAWGGFESSNCFKLGLKEQVGISDRAGEREREFQTEEIALTKLWRHERVC